MWIALTFHTVFCMANFTKEETFGPISTFVKLLSVPRHVGSNVQLMNLSNNAITHLFKGDFSGLSECLYLDLYGNKIRDIDAGAFTGLNNLHALWLDGNSLAGLRGDMWDGLESLKELYLDDNSLTLGPTMSIKNSEYVYFTSSNNWEPPHPNNTSYLHNLTYLSLSHNNIEVLWDYQWMGLPSLLWLYLNSNKIRHMPKGVSG